MRFKWRRVTHWIHGLRSELVAGPRSSEWPALAQAHLDVHPTCANPRCRSKTDVEVHHVRPYDRFPDHLELDPTNLVTLCQECHFEIGHGGSWQAYNPDLENDLKRLEGHQSTETIKNAIRLKRRA